MAVPRVLVYGGKGALGSAVVNMFKTKNWVSYLDCMCLHAYKLNLGRCVLYIYVGTCTYSTPMCTSRHNTSLYLHGVYRKNSRRHQKYFLISLVHK